MTVSAQTPIKRSTANGVTTVFPYDFKILAAADLEVSLDGVVKTLTTDYTLSGVGDDAGGNVTMVTAPANGVTVVRRRNMAYIREVDYQDQGELPTDTLDDDQDAPILMIQQVAEGLSRAVSLPPESSGVSLELPTPGALQYLRWNAAADALESVLLADVSLISLTAYAQTLLNAVDAAAARLVLGITTFGSSLVTAANSAAARIAMGAAASGANSDITSMGNNTSTIYTTGGTSTAYTITPNPTYSAYAAGMSFMVNFNAASGVAPTLSINGIATPPSLVKENADGTYSNIAANDIPANHRSRVTLISTTQALVERIGPRAGDVLQVATFANDAGSSTTSGVLTNLSAGTKSFTPKSTNSQILVKAFFTGQSDLLGGVNTVAYFQVMESGSAAGVVAYIGNATASGGNQSTAPIVAVARLANASLTSRSFTLGGYTSNVSSPASATNQVFEITEIQA